MVLCAPCPVPVRAADGLLLGYLQAGVLLENEASLALHEQVGFRRVGVQERIGRDRTGRWRDRVLLERRSAVTGT